MLERALLPDFSCWALAKLDAIHGPAAQGEQSAENNSTVVPPVPVDLLRRFLA